MRTSMSFDLPHGAARIFLSARLRHLAARPRTPPAQRQPAGDLPPGRPVPGTRFRHDREPRRSRPHGGAHVALAAASGLEITIEEGNGASRPIRPSSSPSTPTTTWHHQDRPSFRPAGRPRRPERRPIRETPSTTSAIPTISGRWSAAAPSNSWDSTWPKTTARPSSRTRSSWTCLTVPALPAPASSWPARQAHRRDEHGALGRR